MHIDIAVKEINSLINEESISNDITKVNDIIND